MTFNFEIEKIDKAALELTLQNGCEPMVSPLGGEMLDIKLDYIKPVYPIDEYKLTKRLVGAIEKNMQDHEGKKIGLMLSGGVDSTLTLHLLKKVYPEMNITAYHTYFEDPTRDERSFASMAAKHYGVDLRIIPMGIRKQIEMIPECVKECNVVMSALPYSYGAAKEIAKDGIEVVLHSLGPDEYFGAYSSDKRFYERKPFFGWVATKGKIARELAKRHGTDKAFFVNNTAVAPGKVHVRKHKYSISKWYDDFFVENVWVTLKRWQWERDMGGQYRLNKQPVEQFEMESVGPLLEKDLAEYCFGSSAISVYNKTPIRSLMRNWGVPEQIVRRGEDWKIGSNDKVGWCPSDKYYEAFTRKFMPDSWSFGQIMDLFSAYVVDNLQQWIVLGDRRAQQIGLFLRMLEEQ